MRDCFVLMDLFIDNLISLVERLKAIIFQNVHSSAFFMRNAYSCA